MTDTQSQPQMASTASQPVTTAPVTPATTAPAASAAPATPAAPVATAPAVSEDKEMVIGKYRVKIIKHLCIGAASCVAVSPTVFELNTDNIAVFVNGATDAEDNLMAAAQSCPTKAIEIYDNATGAKVWPV